MMPIDLEPDPEGRFVWRNGYKDASGHWVMHYLGDYELDDVTLPRYQSHFGSCTEKRD